MGFESGVDVVVRNTFLEFSDDVPALGWLESRRARAVSDLTDMKLPLKVELSNSHGFCEISRHRLSSNVDCGIALGVPERRHSNSPLAAVPEECGDVFGVDGMFGITPQTHFQECMVNNRLSHAVFAAHAPNSRDCRQMFPDTKSQPKCGRNVGGVENRARLQLAAHINVGSQWSEQIVAPAHHIENSIPPHFDGQETTVMLRNLPRNYDRIALLKLLDGHGFHCLYDFVYLPRDFQNGANLGYAFVNFPWHGHAVRLMMALQGFCMWEDGSNQACETSWSNPNQGLGAHVERYRNSPVMHTSIPDEFKPMIFNNGVRTVFPAPTKPIKAPKVRLVRTLTNDSKSNSLERSHS